MKHLAPLAILLYLCLLAFHPVAIASTSSSLTLADTSDLRLTNTIADTAIARQYLDQADSYIDAIDDEKALIYRKKALAIYQQTLGEKDSMTASVYLKVGELYNSLGQEEAALQTISKAKEISIEVLGLPNVIQAQGLLLNADIIRNKGGYDQALQLYKEGLQIFRQKLRSDHDRIAATLFFMAYTFEKKGDYDQALSHYQQYLEITIANFGIDHVNIGKAYTNIGLTWKKKGDYEKALEYYGLSLKNKIKNFGETHPSLGSSYQGIGIIWDLKGDYDKAIGYYQKGIQIKLNQFDEDNFQFFGSYINLGISLKNKGDTDQALYYYNKALAIGKKRFGEDHLAIAFVYYNLGVLMNTKGEYEKAYDFYKKTLAIRSRKLGADHPLIAATYNNMGVNSRKKGDYQQALVFQQKALAIRNKKLGTHHPDRAMTLLNLGNVYLDFNQLDEAKAAYRQAFHVHQYQPSQPNDFSKVADLNLLRSAIASFTDVYKRQFKQTKEQQYLDSISIYFQKILSLENYIQKEYSGQAISQLYTALSFPIYEGAIENILERKKEEELKEAFVLSEKTKSRFLSQKVQASSNGNTFGLPDSLREQEQELGINLALYEKKKFGEEFKSKTPNDSLIRHYESTIFALKQEREQLINRFEADYPEYFQLRYSSQVISVDEIQKDLLTDKQVLVEYFVGDSSLFIFTILKNSFDIQQINIDFPLKEWVQQMREGIYQPFSQKQLPQKEWNLLVGNYAVAAHRLYEKLIAPIESLLPEQAELIIVPDGVLGYIPFDALLSAPVKELSNFREYPYLLKDYQTSVAYSATLLKEMRHKRHRQPPSQNFLAVAPSFNPDSLLLASRFIDTSEERNKLGPLLYNIPEVEALHNLLGGNLLVTEEATEAAFTQAAGNYKILHLSTHGKANDKLGDYSFLAFTEQKDSLENEWLYNRELYELELNADMVVLSACETGIGELQRGEGIISLARGFSYAGAKSIITSLWNVNDRQTPELMHAFYTNLKKGLSKDAALRQAKLDYLASSSNPEPYFWAPFIAIGDMQPIVLKEGWPIWVWGLLIGGILLIGLRLRSRTG